ncbi:hypothetical protein [Symbioplanes lichenis]|uniref:hypothetical protein n=1 Tax=Symbioplanes lichenis TaxID=1629072 RepID=UPI002739D0EA|nr:hypothetical protein [Actinoplanes lichenis]
MTDRTGMRDTGESRRTAILLVALAFVFVPIAFSDDFVEAATEDTSLRYSYLVPIDAGGMILLLGVSLLVHGFRLRRVSYLSWAAATVLTVALDTFLVLGPHSPAIDISLASSYIVAQALALSAVVQASPALYCSGRRRSAQRPEWRRLRGGLPILAGTFAAYLGGVYWDWGLSQGAVRSWEDATREYAKVLGRLTGGDISTVPIDAEVLGVIGSMCGGAISQEYFAQVSQIIPLLLIALGVDAKFFQRAKDPTERAMTIVAVVALCVAEAIAISALPTPNDQCDGVLSEWHEYAAFGLTIAACVIALATLGWALLVRDDAPRRRAGDVHRGRPRE